MLAKGEGYITDDGSFYYAPEQAVSSQSALRFKDALKEVQTMPAEVINFDAVLAYAQTRPDKTITEGCCEYLEAHIDNAEHLYFYATDNSVAEQMNRFTDMFISRTSIGETSAHQVFFSLLCGDNGQTRVAVKPFLQHPKKAIKEWTNTMLAQRAGLDTFRPLGFMIADGVGYAISERRDDVDPLDNVDWTRALVDPSSNAAMLNDLCKVGPSLARLHRTGCFHGDTQLKNIVITQAGELRFIDWESATFNGVVSATASPQISRLTVTESIRDLKVLYGSLSRTVEKQGVGMLAGQTASTRLYHFEQYILNPYLEERLSLLGDDLMTEENAFYDLGEIETAVKDYIKAS